MDEAYLWDKSLIKATLKQCHQGNLYALEVFELENPEIPFDLLRYDASGDTALHHAAQQAHNHIVSYLLLPNHFNVNCRNKDNKTPLHEAAQFGNVETARILLQNGADVDALKKADWTPLMLACTKLSQNGSKMRQLEMVELLMDHEASPAFKNKDGWTVAHLAAREGNELVVEYLYRNFVDLSCGSNNGNTPAHIAALHGHTAIVMDLIDWYPGLVNVANSQGNLLLHEAVLSKNVEHFIEICQIYIDCADNAAPNGATAKIDARNKNGCNIMHLAAQIGSADIFMYILDTLKFDLNTITTIYQHSCLHLTAINRFWSLYKFCLLRGCVDSPDKYGRRPEDYLQ